jgi:hypothetical protein
MAYAPTVKPSLFGSAGDVALVTLRLVKYGKGPNEDQEEGNPADEARFAVSLPTFKPNDVSVGFARMRAALSRPVEVTKKQ